MLKFIDFKELSAYPTANDSPGFLLWRVYFVWKRNIEAALAPHDLTHIQFVLLAAIGYLAKDGSVASQRDLASFAACDVTMTSQVVRSLEKKELITRIRKEGDERAKYPKLTSRGLEKLKKVMKVVEAADEIFFEPLGNDVKRLVKQFCVLLP